MADLTITAANVLAAAGASIERGVAGEAVTAGKVVYLDAAATGKWLLADADAASAAARGQGKIGVALNGASNGQPLAVATDGDITIGATLTAGLDYYLSDDPGGVCPQADLASGDYVTLIGVAVSTTVLRLRFTYTGVST